MLADSWWRKFAATCTAVLGFVLLYQVTMYDSKYAAQIRESTAPPVPGARLRFTATAYCKGKTTASGVAVRTGIAAADSDLLPVGSVIQIDSLGSKYNGIYTIMDSGPLVQGRELDIYMWSCYEALEFGRKPVQLTVLRLGWNPGASEPGIINQLFRMRERARLVRPLPARPLLVPDGATETPSPPAGARVR